MVLLNAILRRQDRRRLLRSMEQLDKPSTSGYSEGHDNPACHDLVEVETDKTGSDVVIVKRVVAIHSDFPETNPAVRTATVAAAVSKPILSLTEDAEPASTAQDPSREVRYSSSTNPTHTTTAHLKTVDIARDVARQCRSNRYNKDAQELASILSSPHVDKLLDAHDQVALMTLRRQQERLGLQVLSTQRSVVSNVSVLGDTHQQPKATATNSQTVSKGKGPRAEQEAASDESASEEEKGEQEFYGKSCEQDNHESSVSSERESSADSLADKPIKVVGVRKIETEPLGITVEVCPESGRLRVARILAGGTIEKQGSLRVGDKIIEMNNIRVSTAENLQTMLRKAKAGTIIFKVIPSPNDQSMHTNSFVKALYSYDPTKDSLLPCKEIGLAFNMGDILQILNTEDPNWWQARRVGTWGHAGLIPSQELEERRRAFVPAEFDYATTTTMCGTKLTRHKRTIFYETRLADEFEKAELALYEEVTKIPPFERKTLVLVGANGVGRRSLRNRLIEEHPGLFGVPLPHTSRPIRVDEIDGKVYHFASRERMEADIADNAYLEWGEFGGHLYGTKLDSIREISNKGRMVILDCSPQYLKVLKSPEFMSYVVFIAAPPIPELRGLHEGGRYGSKYGKLDLNLTFDRAMSRQSRRALTLQSLASLQELHRANTWSGGQGGSSEAAYLPDMMKTSNARSMKARVLSDSLPRTLTPP
ncbi:MAGUK p55 subfamily member 6-like isoform X2 [Varroa destructor]|uniref:Uncharacterized protein n=1 Tax=Varroa destructor TaxID=109461 RepID=A0A7M7KKK3_VARDE|nr:MAGUK p55 subfamily member 6-like isoform X2 [Varroa destructor]